jgi:hypothetical protein
MDATARKSRRLAEALRLLPPAAALLIGMNGRAAGGPPATALSPADSLLLGPAPRDSLGRPVEVWRVPALAAEDTFGVRVRYATRTIEVDGKRIMLRDILERARAGERRRREAIRDVTYTEELRFALIGSRGGDEDRRRIYEARNRVYFKRPDRELRIELAERQYGDQDAEEKTPLRASVSVDVRDALDFAAGPFYLEDIDSYRYEIRDRRLFPDRVLYAVGFAPRSDFDPLPEGTFWIDTAEFVVVHEEMRFARNPVPLILESVDEIVRERRRVDGHWVVTRIQVKAAVRSALVFGFKTAEMEAVFSDFAFDQGLDDALFERR